MLARSTSPRVPAALETPGARSRGPRASAALGPGLGLLLLALLPAAASAQGRWVDIGAGVGFTIAVEGDPESREVFPPYAFGTFSPGNYVYLELLPWPPSGLPAPLEGGEPAFVRAVQAYLDTGTCPCTGALFTPVAIELRYDTARVQALGGREEDLRLVMYDADAAAWVDVPAQSVEPPRDLVTGSHSSSGRQFFAILLRPQPASTWGRIKAQWAGSP